MISTTSKFDSPHSPPFYNHTLAPVDLMQQNIHGTAEVGVGFFTIQVKQKSQETENIC